MGQVIFLLLYITNTISIDSKHSLPLRQARAVIDLADPLLPPSFPQVQSGKLIMIEES
jgi:hypothetical protein